MKTLTYDGPRGYWTPRRRIALARLALLAGSFSIIATSAAMGVVSLF